MSSAAVSYLLFDIESIADGNLIKRIRYPDKDFTPAEAVQTFCAERLEQYGSEFIPYTFHVPVSVAVIKISVDLKIIDIVTLDSPQFRSHVITKHFWDGWRAYKQPTLVTFNGRTFDIPLMELSAFRYGIPIPDWFNIHDRSYEQKRNRYNQKSHLDLQEVITNFGTTRLSGGLNLLANLIGRPGKMGIAGHMVQELYDNGQLREIDNYCRCDVLDTYFVMLRCKLLTGEISLAQEQELVDEAVHWLRSKADEFPVYADYLEQCHGWDNPWIESPKTDNPTDDNEEIDPADLAQTANPSPDRQPTDQPAGPDKNESSP